MSNPNFIKGYTKVVINHCSGGFGLSTDAIRKYLEYSGKSFTEIQKQIGYDHRKKKSIYETVFMVDGQEFDVYFLERPENRTDPSLVRVVEELGRAAGGRFGDPIIVSVEKGCKYRIKEYDGMEHVEILDLSKWMTA